MRYFLSLLLAISTITSIYCQTYHPLKLPSIIASNMILQQKTNVPIWGWTSSNKEVRIKASWLEDEIITRANTEGSWRVKLPTLATGGDYAIKIYSQNEVLEINDILFGEVWLASGQSNMEMPVKGWGDLKVDGSKDAIRNAYNPNIRLFQVKPNTSTVPLNDCDGQWVDCSPQDAANFSAVAYFFASKLEAELNIPIGIIHSSWGGTKAQVWVKKDRLLEMADFKQEIEQLDSLYLAFEEGMTAFENTMKQWGEFEKYDPARSFPYYLNVNKSVLEKWKKLHENMGDSYENINDFPKPEIPNTFPQFMVTTLYNAMIHPIIPFSIKGVIWYQGESNSVRPKQYETLFPLLIDNWRTDWQQGDFPFYFVQIAPYRYHDDHEGHWDPVVLRDSQLKTMLNTPNTGMAVIHDVTDTTNIHPPNKQAVGNRLALWALAKNYGQNEVVCSGPVYKSMKIEGDKIRLFFDYDDTSLVCQGSALRYFQIANSDEQFVDAVAIIDKNSILVSSKNIKNPLFVRLGWDHTAQPNLFNGAGLPASPFNTLSLFDE